jgi:hypothetical protein
MTEDSLPVGTYCGKCRMLLAEALNLAVEAQTPCPLCKSLSRLKAIDLAGGVKSSGALAGKAKSPPGVFRGPKQPARLPRVQNRNGTAPGLGGAAAG